MTILKILTDIEISQCPVWQEQTFNFTSNIGASNVWLRFLYLLKVQRSFDVYISADIKLAQLFGLLRTIFRLKKPKHIILELMLDEEREDILWKMKKLFQRLCFFSVDCIFVSSTSEILTYAQRFQLPMKKFCFLPFHTNITSPGVVRGKGYIFSAGKTGRDFSTLAKAVDRLDIKVVVVGNHFNLEGIEFPSNVEVYRDISYDHYLQLLQDCSLVVVPLKRLVKSTGQVALLEAMGLGKPVIATKTIGTTDYIEHGSTGILVPPGDVQALREAIEKFIKDPNCYISLAFSALNQVKENHTFERYTQAILKQAEFLCGNG